MKLKKESINLILYICIATAAVLSAFFLTYNARGYFCCRSFIIEYSKKYGLDKAEVAAIIKTESNFNNKAVSPAGAIGLMQIIPETAQYISEFLSMDEYDLFDSETNIKFGCFYLSYLKKKFPYDETAYAAYNAGEGRVTEWLSDEKYSSDGVTLYNIPFKETSDYVKKISILKKLFRLM